MCTNYKQISVSESWRTHLVLNGSIRLLSSGIPSISLQPPLHELHGERIGEEKEGRKKERRGKIVWAFCVIAGWGWDGGGQSEDEREDEDVKPVQMPLPSRTRTIVEDRGKYMDNGGRRVKATMNITVNLKVCWGLCVIRSGTVHAPSLLQYVSAYIQAFKAVGQ